MAAAVATERPGTCLAKPKRSLLRISASATLVHPRTSRKPAASPYCVRRGLMFVSPPVIPRWGIGAGANNIMLKLCAVHPFACGVASRVITA